MNNHRFIKAPKAIDQLAGKIIKASYPETLAKWKPRFDFLYCFAPKDEAGNPSGNALMLHSRPCAATIAIVNLKNRALGMGDVLICIDADLWPKWTDAQKEAIIDHELYHLKAKMKKGEETAIKTDDLDRPIFTIRPHDYEVGWFIEIAARHGVASIEVQQALMIKKRSGQLLFDFEGAEQAILAMEQQGVDETPSPEFANV